MLAFRLCKEFISNLLQFSQTTLLKLEIFILEHGNFHFGTFWLFINSNLQQLSKHKLSFCSNSASILSISEEISVPLSTTLKEIESYIDKIDGIVRMLKFQASIA